VPPSYQSATGVLFRAFKNLNTLEDKIEIVGCLDKYFMGILDDLIVNRSVTSLRDSMRALSILCEVDEVMCSTSPEQVEEEWERIVSRKSWLHGERYVENAASPCKDCTAKTKRKLKVSKTFGRFFRVMRLSSRR
jgi:ataxia telangiectasia mutated family protein